MSSPPPQRGDVGGSCRRGDVLEELRSAKARAVAVEDYAEWAERLKRRIADAARGLRSK
eukprot:gene13203-9929_t